MEIHGYTQNNTGRHGILGEIFFSVLSGILLALAFPRFNLFGLAWLALVPFFLVLSRTKRLGSCLLVSFFFGISFFGLHLFWLESLSAFVGWWSVFGLVCLVFFQTLFIILFGLLFCLVKRLVKNYLVVQGLLISLAWVGVEWLRASGSFGLTCGDLGYSQVQFLTLLQIAGLLTVYGISALVVFFNLAVTAFLQEGKNRFYLILAAC